MCDKRLLIVDDDASWINCLPTFLYKEYRVETNLADGLKQIDGRRKWDAAIFDLCLMEGELPFGKGCLSREAGYILTLAFQEKFPGKRVAICSGYSIDDNNLIKKLIDGELCTFVQKQKYMNRFFGQLGHGNVPAYSERADDIINFLLKGTDKQFSRSWLDCLLLEPNFCGIGVNLRTLIDTLLKKKEGC
jgi:hypothetical protein